jgi:glycosyltransferase involved in cell wall biosynthesis
MRVAAITRVLNEADIIEAFVRHSAAFVSHHVFVDNGSADGTIKILHDLAAEGLPISVYQSRAVTFNESDALTQLYVQACQDVAPDWVLCLDADEFLDDRHTPNGLHSLLADYAAAADRPDYLKIPMVNYIATSFDDQSELIAPLRMRRRRPPSDSYKIIVSGGLQAEQLSIQHGSHWAKLRGRQPREVVETRLWLAHFSERSPYQYVMKFVRGWAKVLATGKEELEKKTAYHYKGPFEHLRDRPANLLRNPHFMGFKDENAELVEDLMLYRGGPLKFTSQTDEAMRAVRSLMGLLDDLATRHGLLMDEFPFVRAAVQDWEQRTSKLF